MSCIYTGKPIPEVLELLPDPDADPDEVMALTPSEQSEALPGQEVTHPTSCDESLLDLFAEPGDDPVASDGPAKQEESDGPDEQSYYWVPRSWYNDLKAEAVNLTKKLKNKKIKLIPPKIFYSASLASFAEPELNVSQYFPSDSTNSVQKPNKLDLSNHPSAELLQFDFNPTRALVYFLLPVNFILQIGITLY